MKNYKGGIKMLLHQPLYDWANRHPNKPAFHWVERDKTLTYAEAVEEVEALAGALHSLGAAKGDRITIFAHNGMDYLLSMLGISETPSLHGWISRWCRKLTRTIKSKTSGAF